MNGNINLLYNEGERHLYACTRGSSSPSTFVVVDEADQMMDGKFAGQVKTIMSQIRPDRQIVLFAATWQERVEKFAMELCVER